MRKFLNINTKSFDDLTQKQIWEKAVADGYNGLTVQAVSEFTKAEDTEDKNTFDVIFSSANEDRHGDIVHQEFDLKQFKKNSVFLDSHNYDSIVHILGSVSKARVEEKRLRGRVTFAVANPKGELARQLVLGGFLNATSIGFIPREFNDKGEIIKSELLEISAVSVPANADALFERSVDPEKKEPEAIPEKIEIEPVIETPIKPDVKALTLKAVNDISFEKTKLLNGIAMAVQKLKSDGQESHKRKIFQAIRRLQEEI